MNKETMKYTIYTKKTFLKELLKISLPCIASFIIPIIIAGISFFLSNVYPGGTNTILTHDLRGEVLPFYSYLSRIGQEYNGFFYGITQGLGGNFWGVFAFDLSPIDIIYCFCSIQNLPNLIYFMILFRIGLAGLFCYLFISKCNISINSIAAITLSCCYALMSYSIIYSSWPIFQVSVVLLPILALNLDKIIQGYKSPEFIFFMSYNIICCYYTAYMSVIALILYFLFRIIEEKIDFKTLINKLLAFTIHGFLSAGISLFILIPVILDLKRGKLSSEDIFVSSSYIKFNLFEVLKNQLPLSYSNLNSNQLPNIYCSSLVVILVLIYLLNNSRIQEKIACIVIILLYICSFIFTPIDTFWHGFSEPTGYSCRYAYTFVFFMICFAVRGISSLNNMKINISSGLKKLTIYTITIYTYFELFLNSSFIISKIAEDYIYDNQAEYIRLCETMNNTLDIISTREASPFYRVAKNFRFSSQDNALYGYNGLEYFCSSYNGNVIKFCRDLGLYSNYNVINTTGLNPAVSSLFDIKYYISYFSDMSDYYEHIDNYHSYDIYQNNNALPLAFELKNLYNIDSSVFSSDPYENINSVYCDISEYGKENPIFEKVDYQLISFSYSPEANTNVINITFNSPKEGHYWLYIDSVYDQYDNYTLLTKNARNLTFYLDGQLGGSIGEHDRRFCTDIGLLSKETEHSLTIDVDTSIGANIYLYYFNDENLKNICSSVNGFNVTENTTKGIQLTGYMDNSGELFISLPYEKGYIIRVNGQIKQYASYRDTFLLLNLEEGQNDILITYIPNGLVLGTILSIISIILTLSYMHISSITNFIGITKHK